MRSSKIVITHATIKIYFWVKNDWASLAVLLKTSSPQYAEISTQTKADKSSIDD